MEEHGRGVGGGCVNWFDSEAAAAAFEHGCRTFTEKDGRLSRCGVSAAWMKVTGQRDSWFPLSVFTVDLDFKTVN